MNAQQLKNAILQEAIEGRLVPQDPNDEPASILLEKIRKEKERLVKEGKLKKKDLEVKPITEDEIPFEIPESWEWVRLKDMVFFIGGYAYDSQSFISSSSYQVLRLGNIKNDSILLNVNPVFISQELAEETLRFSCKDCDILITMTGTRKKRDYFYSVLVDDTHKDLFVNQRVGCLRPYNSSIAKWLIKVLKTETVLQQVFQYETGTANQGNLGAENILKTLIPLPPLAEQYRIVAKIEELLPKVEKYGKAQDELNKLNEELPERLKKSILQEAIEGRLVPQDPNDEPASVLLEKIREEKKQLFKAGKLKKKDLVETPISEDEIPFEIPESWEWVRVSEISESYIGLTYKPTDVSDKGWIVLRSSNIQNGKIYYNDIVRVNMDVPPKLHVHNNDIIICARNGSKKLVGKSAIVKNATEPITFGAFMAICRTQFYQYMSMYLLSPLFFDQLRKDSDTTTINQLTQKNFNSYLVPLPPLAEQKRIVAKIEQLLGEIDKLKK